MKRIDAVLPIVPRDFARFQLLGRSLERFMHELGTLYLVVPASSVDSPELGDALRGLRLPIKLIAEREWLPGIERVPLRGWYKQQLLKLAASEFVASDFYLTLDADVICTRHCDYDKLVPGGKARCFVMQQADHQDWYDGAEAVLGLRAARREVLHNVTPVVWSTEGVRATVQHIDQRARHHHWAAGLRGWRQRLDALLGRAPGAAAWVRYLAGATPWAEYAAYFTYLESMKQFERYHFEDGACIYDIERSLWKSTTSIDDWNPTSLFEGAGPPYFIVVQSNAKLPVPQLWRALEPWLGSAPNS